VLSGTAPAGYDYPHLNSFDNYRHFGPDDEAEIPISLTSVPHERWPEAPDKQRFFCDGVIGVSEIKAKFRSS
jgi:hypothetical protein